ncbi:membrane hypothetical protein [[Clostridium] ultunense Esp]|nr:membrane hypothetical protein [[Clostridium] ultunense Esp]
MAIFNHSHANVYAPHLWKGSFLPAFLHLFLPVSDFRATLYEILILIIGVVSAFLTYMLGSFSRSYYRCEKVPFLLFLFLLLVIYLFFRFVYSFTPFTFFVLEWVDLLAEPYRLLTFSYLYSEWVGLFLFILFLWMGYEGKRAEERRWRQLGKAFPSL